MYGVTRRMGCSRRVGYRSGMGQCESDPCVRCVWYSAARLADEARALRRDWFRRDASAESERVGLSDRPLRYAAFHRTHRRPAGRRRPGFLRCDSSLADRLEHAGGRAVSAPTAPAGDHSHHGFARHQISSVGLSERTAASTEHLQPGWCCATIVQHKISAACARATDAFTPFRAIQSLYTERAGRRTDLIGGRTVRFAAAAAT